MRRLIFLSLMVSLILLPSVAFSEVVRLDVPKYDQNDFLGTCTMDCTPTAAAMILGYWDSHGWPKMVPRGTANYDENPDQVADLVEDLENMMNYDCNEGTSPASVAPGIIETASNMDPGADFRSNDINCVVDATKEMVFQAVKNWINNGWPILFTAAPGLKYYCGIHDTIEYLPGDDPHSMVITGYLDSPLIRRIYLNSGWGAHDDFWVDWDDMDLDLSDPTACYLWLQYVIPGGVPTLDMWNKFFFRCNVGQNSINWGWRGCDPYSQPPVCNNLVIGCNVDPVSSTTLVAENTDTGYSMVLPFTGGGVNPYEFGRRFAYDPAKTGPWVITATNGPSVDQITTHAIDAAGKMPFLENVALNGTGLTPVISWTVPSGADADRLLLNVIDRNTYYKLWWSDPIQINETSARIDDGVLQADYPYLIRAMVEKTVSGTIYGKAISRAESFFDFTPLEEGEPNQVFLPTVGPDPDPTDEFGSAFMFSIDVEEGVPCFIDPDVAIGYDYAIGEEDTVKFASVTLPEVGDNLFDLFLYNGLDFYLAQKNLPAGVRYDFGLSGVDRFRVLGIAKAAELDPNDTTAFITELTFTGTGRFTGTQTPLVVFLNDSGSQLVTIDIKPGSYPNCFNVNGHGVIPVAIIGSAVLDVNQIDIDTLQFAELDVRIKGNGTPQCSVEDVSGNFTSPEGVPDGTPDLVCQFVDESESWSPDNGTATVTGMLIDGTSIQGTDEICMAP